MELENQKTFLFWPYLYLLLSGLYLGCFPLYFVLKTITCTSYFADLYLTYGLFVIIIDSLNKYSLAHKSGFSVTDNDGT